MALVAPASPASSRAPLQLKALSVSSCPHSSPADALPLRAGHTNVMSISQLALEMARSFVRAIHGASLNDVPAMRDMLSLEATPDAKDELICALANSIPTAPSRLRSSPPEVQRAMHLLGDLIEQAPSLSDQELLEGLQAFADLFSPIIFHDPP